MAQTSEPLVSIVTPVYNGDGYLAECIESVLAQTYSNWEYVVVNNASTDRTLEIAEMYASKDKRIRVYSNETLLPIIANHNHAFSLISQESKYCKVVSADDWLFPECLARMVDLAEAHPSIGLVGSYQLSGGGDDMRNWHVRFDELPYPSALVPGAKICRSHLLGGPHVFGAPTSVLYRADLVRRSSNFYPNVTAEADVSACYECLKTADFGFVHQVLSYERVHNDRQTAESAWLNAYVTSRLADLLEYGPYYLSSDEVTARREQLLHQYYRFLTVSAIQLKDRKFWEFHKRRLEQLGHPLSYVEWANAIVDKLTSFLPKKGVAKTSHR